MARKTGKARFCLVEPVAATTVATEFAVFTEVYKDFRG